jgi:hypothetical protein
MIKIGRVETKDMYRKGFEMADFSGKGRLNDKEFGKNLRLGKKMGKW